MAVMLADVHMVAIRLRDTTTTLEFLRDVGQLPDGDLDALAADLEAEARLVACRECGGWSDADSTTVWYRSPFGWWPPDPGEWIHDRCAAAVAADREFSYSLGPSMA